MDLGEDVDIDLSTLDGTNGFRIDGIDEGDFSGSSVSSAGDFNGDGFDDVIIGALQANVGAGECYVVFGSSDGFAPNLDLSTLDGSNGVRIIGSGYSYAFGESVSSAGDINGDGFDDVIIGDSLGYAAKDSPGASHVVFGGPSVGATIDIGSLDGGDGFTIIGDSFDLVGKSVSSAGDFNGDGLGDIVIGAAGNFYEDDYAGSSFVIFGSSSGFAPIPRPATIDGSNGFRIDGVDAYDESGHAVSGAGDVNGDGFDDVIIGARLADAGGTNSGESYVVFGGAGAFPASLDLSTLDGTNGFRIDGIDSSDFSGRSVSAAGDVNGDGFGDVIIGADGAGSGQRFDAGESYVVFGAPGGFSASLDLATLDGDNGFRIDGRFVYDNSGVSVSGAGDVNGDGIDDVIIGADYANAGFPRTDPNSSGSYAGESYVVFGSMSGFPASLDLRALDDSTGFRIDGAAPGDRSGSSVSSAGDVNGDGIDDLIIGAFGADPNGAANSGASYVVFGESGGGSSDIVVELIDAITDTPIATLEDGTVVPLSDIEGKRVTIAATVPAGSPFFGGVESMVLDLNDGQAVRTENVEPYALFGDNQGGTNFFPGPLSFTLPVGANSIDFDLFAQNKAQSFLETISVDFTILDDISGGNTPPVAVDDTATSQGSSTVIDVLDNDFDPDAGDQISIQSFTQPVGGSVSEAGDSLVFVPDQIPFQGQTSFEYTIADLDGATSTATVTVNGDSTGGSVTALASIDGEQKNQGVVDTVQAGRDNDLEIGNGDTSGLLFDDVAIADGAQVSNAFITATAQRKQNNIDKTFEIGLFDGSEGVGLSGAGALTTGFDFFSTETVSGSFAKNDDVVFDVTDTVIAFLADEQAANGDETYDMLFSLATDDGIFRINPEEAGNTLAAELTIEFV